MKVLWFTWKDRKNPAAGGAEFINEEIAKRLASEGHEVIFIVSGFLGGDPEETANGYRVIRVGNRWTVYFSAFNYYRRHLQGWADLIVEEINTIPFLTQLYAGGERRVLLIYQLCRAIWFYQMFFPLNVIGYFLEPLYLFLMRKNISITESESTKKDLKRFGFNERKIHIIPICIGMQAIESLADATKYAEPTVLSLGALRSMKRTIHEIKAFNIAKESVPELKLIIAGEGSNAYKEKVLVEIANSPFKDDIRFLGRVGTTQKNELMLKSHALLVASVKEGWGLTVTEAASQGTPSIVYNVDGLRDSVKDGYSGFVCKRNSPAEMASRIIELFADKNKYERIRENAWKLSKIYTPERCYHAFAEILETV